MPYLSRIWLNPLRTGTQRFLRSPQVMHAAVLGGLPSQAVTERVLWRLEPGRHRASLLVLTQSRPSWEHIVEQAGWPGAEEPQAKVRSYEPLLEQVTAGAVFAFRLRANPASSTRNPESPSLRQKERLAQERPRGVRVGHRTAGHQLNWLISRIPAWGFELADDDQDEPAVRLIARERMVFSKSSPPRGGIPRAVGGRPEHRVTLESATFEGIALVTDPDLACRSLLAGVGSGKAYGLGLLTLARPNPEIA